MKSLADIRRRFKNGTRLEVTKHTLLPEQVGQTRVVVTTSTTQVCWRLNGSAYFSKWPKARDVRITGPHSYEYDVVRTDGSAKATIGLRFVDLEEEPDTK